MGILAMFKLVFVLTLISVALSQQVVLPVGIIPGLGDFCDNPISMKKLISEIQGAVPNKIFCIDAAPSTKSLMTAFSSQLDNACTIVSSQADALNLKNGFIMMGLSQGGLLA